MHSALLGLAASIAVLTVTAAPADAQSATSSSSSLSGSFATSSSVRVHHGGKDGDRDRRDRRRGDSFVSYGDREYQGDTTWRYSSFNDWWHERPHRSYPAWMARNEHCKRVWWSGGGWTC